MIGRRGGALIELLVSAVVSLVVGAVVMVAYADAVNLRAFTGEGSKRKEVGRLALEGIVDRLRNAAYNPATGSPLASGSPNSITYFAPRQGVLEPIELRLQGDTLVRAASDDVEALCSDVDSLEFVYYQRTQSGQMFAPTADPSMPTADEVPAIVGVEVVMTARTGSQRETMQAFVRLRNNPR